MKQLLITLLANAVLLPIYFLAAKYGLSLATVHASATAVWPATGIALAAVMLLGYRVWPAIWVGAFWANHITAGTLITSAGIATGNTLEAVMGALLVNQFAGGRSAFDRAGGVFRFVFYAAFVSTAISATIGVTVLEVERQARWENYGTIWLTWWLGDLVGALIVTPLLVIWLARRPTWRSLRRLPEALALLIAVAVVGLAVFGPWLRSGGKGYPLEYLVILPLLWAAFRFLQHGASAASFISSAIAIWGTVQGYGPFSNMERNASLLLLQRFMGTISVTTMVLSAIVAERRQAETTLRDWELRFRQLAENIREVFYITQLHPMRLMYISPGYEEVWGRSCPSLYENPRSFLDAIHPDDRQRVAESLEDQMRGRPTDHEYRIIRPDGSMRWVWDRAVPVRDEKGRAYRITGIAEDITERRQHEEERAHTLSRERAARQEAELANQAKDNFLAVLSHELRTPLTPVLLITSLLERQEDLPPEVIEQLKSIRRNVELEARLIDDLLDLTRVTRGKLQLNLEIADAHDILRRSLEVCRRPDTARIELELSAKEHFVRADPARFQQVICNLLDNAQKFTPPAGVIRLRSSNHRPDGIRLEVQDTGIGIEPQMLPKLFNAFEQIEGSGAKRLGGLGLGLAISKSLVKAHGGSLSASSAGKGQGATFTVELPTATPAASTARTEVDQLLAAIRPLKVLLVEDHVPTQRALSKLLEKMGHKISAAGDVKSALSLAENTCYDLLISDIGLPDGTGHELMHKLRQRYDITGIALSGYGMEDDVRRSRDAGFDEHLTKPVTMETLEAVIGRLISSPDA